MNYVEKTAALGFKLEGAFEGFFYWEGRLSPLDTKANVISVLVTAASHEDLVQEAYMLAHRMRILLAVPQHMDIIREFVIASAAHMMQDIGETLVSEGVLEEFDCADYDEGAFWDMLDHDATKLGFKELPK